MNQRVCIEEVWVRVAELFFLDTEPGEEEFVLVADLIRSQGWSREYTEWLLVRAIAPHAGANLGYLVLPAIGEWAGFNQEKLCKWISQSIAFSRGKPDWYFLISDWWCRRMLNRLGMQRLLKLL